MLAVIFALSQSMPMEKYDHKKTPHPLDEAFTYIKIIWPQSGAVFN